MQFPICCPVGSSSAPAGWPASAHACFCPPLCTQLKCCSWLARIRPEVVAEARASYVLPAPLPATAAAVTGGQASAEGGVHHMLPPIVVSGCTRTRARSMGLHCCTRTRARLPMVRAAAAHAQAMSHVLPQALLAIALLGAPQAPLTAAVTCHLRRPSCTSPPSSATASWRTSTPTSSAWLWRASSAERPSSGCSARRRSGSRTASLGRPAASRAQQGCVPAGLQDWLWRAVVPLGLNRRASRLFACAG